MKLFSLKNAVIASAIGMFGIVGSASAQVYNSQYREWQRAQQRAQQEMYDYQRSGSRSDYRQWQEAQRRAQIEYQQYQQSVNGYNNSGYYNNGYRNNGYNNSGYYNNGYNNGGVTVVNGYRVYRNGSYYETNQRGVALLRQAVNSGYQQGYRQGQVDRQYGRGGSYYGNNVYNEGTYGYQSYVDRSQYQYYFQQGFQRGYQDGYNSRTQYGYRSGNSYNILGSILNSILQLSR